MIDILARLAERQGSEPINQPRNQERGDDRSLERFLKSVPLKFHGGSDSKAVENWFERIILGTSESKRLGILVEQLCK